MTEPTQTPIPVKYPNEQEQENINKFLKDLVEICNRNRIWIAIKTLGCLQSEPHDNKLLDVEGFYLDDKTKDILPYYVDRLS